MKINQIIQNLDDPYKLEELYQDNPDVFHAWLREANLERPDLPLLNAWIARLNYVKIPEQKVYKPNALLVTILLSILAIIAIKLPEYIIINNSWFYSRFSVIIVFSTLVFYFMFTVKTKIYIKFSLCLSLLASIIVMVLMPNKEKSDSITMASLHMPMVLYGILGIAFTQGEWRNHDARLRYIRYIGEIIVYSSIILFGGALLTFLTISLFSLININIDSWYIEYVVVWGLVSCPVVSTYLYDVIMKRESKIISVIANVFSPLFLVTVLAYLAAMFFKQKSPYSDREFLITFNGLLLAVWGITVFSISGKSKENSKLTDYINIALVFCTIIINIVALSAILFRLSEYGITPNRTVVTGANILIFTHLILILIEYIKHFRKNLSLFQLNYVIASYLPIYTFWSIFVVVALPIIFNYS